MEKSKKEAGVALAAGTIGTAAAQIIVPIVGVLVPALQGQVPGAEGAVATLFAAAVVWYRNR